MFVKPNIYLKALTYINRVLLPDAKALVRLQSDHISRTLVPAFYRYLQAQDPEAQISGGKEFHAAIQSLVDLFERAEKEVGGTGLWVEGGDLGWADVVVAPCRCSFLFIDGDGRH
jgi:glutathione S-transferase